MKSNSVVPAKKSQSGEIPEFDAAFSSIGIQSVVLHEEKGVKNFHFVN